MNRRWTIHLLGRLAACPPDGEPITRFATHKTAALLAYLAYHRQQTHTREALIEMLWPEDEELSLSTGRNRLSTQLTFLRHILEPLGTPPGTVVQADRMQVRLNADLLTTDVAEF